MKIIDTHCHVYPKLSYLLKENISKLPTPLLPLIDKLEILENKNTKNKEALALLIKPFLTAIHNQQSKFNNNSNEYLYLKDKVFSLTGLTMLLSSTLNDLKQEMRYHNLHKSIIIAHPPLISNDFVLESARKDSSLVPVINIPLNTKNPTQLFNSYLERGAKALKIHAAADGLDPMDEHYHLLLALAEKNKLPVIVHTGALEVEPVYKEPKFGHAELFESWLRKYKTNFILAHMNIHFPRVAIELCKKYKNVYTDISFQNQDSILEAIKVAGSKKIMFGTDWPIIGNNIEVNLNRIQNLFNLNEISSEDFENIMYKNAENLFKI